MRSYALQSALERYLQPIDNNMTIYYGDAMDLSSDHGLAIDISKLGYLVKTLSGTKYHGSTARVYLLYNSAQVDAEEIMTAKETCAKIEKAIIDLQNEIIPTRNDLKIVDGELKFNKTPAQSDDGVDVCVGFVNVENMFTELGKGPEGHQQYYMIFTCSYGLTGYNHIPAPTTAVESDDAESSDSEETGTSDEGEQLNSGINTGSDEG